MSDSLNKIDTGRIFYENLKGYNDEFDNIINQGGISSTKTYSILQGLFLIAESSLTSLLISVVSETMPHLKRGAMRDFFSIIAPWYSVDNHNKTDNVYQVNKSYIEFFAADDESKQRGARRDILFLNEINNIKKQAYDQLEPRTRICTFSDFNPVSRFWMHDMEGQDHVKFIRSTYLDNKHLTEKEIRKYERRKDIDPNWWKVYGLGEIGTLEGLVFANWSQIESFPEQLDYWCGMDFGYTNNPSTLIRMAVQDDNLYVDELFYRAGLKSPDIARMTIDDTKEYTEVFADSEDPRVIDEIYAFGVNIYGVKKGPGSVDFGIDVLKRYNIRVTKRSLNLIKELRNYMYMKDKNGEPLNKPIKAFDHAIDAMRYAAMSKLNVQIDNSWVV